MASWALRQQAHPLWGPAAETLESERDRLRTALPSDQVDACEALGGGLTPTAAAALAVEALRRHVEG